jgi:hypothetical protein
VVLAEDDDGTTVIVVRVVATQRRWVPLAAGRWRLMEAFGRLGS